MPPQLTGAASKRRGSPPRASKLPSYPSSSVAGAASNAGGDNGAGAGGGGNVDKVLFKNLVEMVPLVETLMHRRANSSFTRRASVVYTAAPMRKGGDLSGRKTSQTFSAKKRRENGGNIESATDDLSLFSSTAANVNVEKDREELTMLEERIEDLQKKLLEKDEALKSAENSMNQTYAAVTELKHEVADQDSLIKSTNSQLYNAKIKLADKQAALEKLEWEANASNRKVEELEGNLLSTEFEITALMKFFDELSKHDSIESPDLEIDSFSYAEQLPHIAEIDLEQMEEARTAYLAAVCAAKENPSEELIVAAADARRRLQAFV